MTVAKLVEFEKLEMVSKAVAEADSRFSQFLTLTSLSEGEKVSLKKLMQRSLKTLFEDVKCWSSSRPFMRRALCAVMLQCMQEVSFEGVQAFAKDSAEAELIREMDALVKRATDFTMPVVSKNMALEDLYMDFPVYLAAMVSSPLKAAIMGLTQYMGGTLVVPTSEWYENTFWIQNTVAEWACLEALHNHGLYYFGTTHLEDSLKLSRKVVNLLSHYSNKVRQNKAAPELENADYVQVKALEAGIFQGKSRVWDVKAATTVAYQTIMLELQPQVTLPFQLTGNLSLRSLQDFGELSMELSQLTVVLPNGKTACLELVTKEHITVSTDDTGLLDIEGVDTDALSNVVKGLSLKVAQAVEENAKGG